jgi:hypothetical protein
MKLSTGTSLWFPEVKVLDPRSYVGIPGGYVAPRSCFLAPRNSTKAPGSKRAPRAKMCIPRADKAVNRGMTDFVRVGMEILQDTYDFLGLCDPWAAYIILESALEILTATKADGYLRRAGRQPPPACYIKPPSILLQYWPRLVG